jgi:hypothetical protein
MSRTSATHRADAGAWRASVLRLSMFSEDGRTPKTEGFWEAIFDVQPDNTICKPKMFERVDVGNQNDMRVMLQSKQLENRVDLLFDVLEGSDGNQMAYVDAIKFYKQVAPKLLAREEFKNVIRLAFGAIIVLPAHDAVSGYKTLCNYLNFDIEYGEAKDLMYQINRPRQSKSVSGIEINRLSKWSVATKFSQKFSITPHGAMAEAAELVSVGCLLDLDINNTPTDTSIPKSNLLALSDELVSLADEIIKEGDIA